MSEYVQLTQADLYAMLVERFGADPWGWAFQCPACDDVATVRALQDALDAAPRTNREGAAVVATHIIGQECIGRSLGALENPPTNERGCDWVAFGLIPGPWEVLLPGGRSMRCFPVADAAAVSR